MYYTSRTAYEFISQQTADPIVEWKICRVSGTEFPIFQSDLDFYAKIAPTFAGQKFMIPTPTLCPEERQRRRLAFRNERKFYRRSCDATGENIISLYSPDKPYKVYNPTFRFSDKRDPMDYGRDVDFTQSINSQIDALNKVVPLPSMMSIACEKSEYTSGTGYCKDCYMICASEYAEKCMYGKLYQSSSYIVDSLNIFKSEHIYEWCSLKECNNCHFLSNSVSCYSCHFSDSLTWCSHCLFCSGLQNKSYHIFNKEVSKEEYQTAVEKYSQSPAMIAEWKNILHDYLAQSPFVYAEIKNSVKSFGNELFDCKNVVAWFSINEAEDCKYIGVCEQVKSLQDCNNMYVLPELCYEMMGAIDIYNCHFSTYVFEKSRDMYYCLNCHGCTNCFACIGLSKKSYCILNKQYSKEEYEQTVATIISHMQTTGEWWEFLHPSLSPFGYNESVAQDYFPLVQDWENERKREWEKSLSLSFFQSLWFKRSLYSSDPVIPVGTQTLSGEQIAADITTVTDEILKKVLICEVSNRPYRIVKQELDFYRQHHLPLPRRHPDQRHTDRMALRPPREMHLRTCDKTGHDMISVYPQDVPFKVYSEEAYTQEVYG